MHFDNSEAAQLLSYFRSGGWLESLGVSILQKKLDEDYEGAMDIVSRITSSMSSEKYIALMKWVREKDKEKG